MKGRNIAKPYDSTCTRILFVLSVTCQVLSGSSCSDKKACKVDSDCSSYLVCHQGVCVDPARICGEVLCPKGQICIRGKCTQAEKREYEPDADIEYHEDEIQEDADATAGLETEGLAEPDGIIQEGDAGSDTDTTDTDVDMNMDMDMDTDANTDTDGGEPLGTITLTNDMAIRNVSIGPGDTHYYKVILPVGTSYFKCIIGTMDWRTNQDMIVSYGLPAPDPNGYPIGEFYTCADNPNWWCRVYPNSSNESVRLTNNIQAGTYYIMVHNTSSVPGLYEIMYSAY